MRGWRLANEDTFGLLAFPVVHMHQGNLVSIEPSQLSFQHLMVVTRVVVDPQTMLKLQNKALKHFRLGVLILPV